MGENIYRIFDVVWKLSLVGGYCVLLVLLARLLLKKAPKWYSYRKRQTMRLVELPFLCQTLKNTKKLIVF